MSDVVSVVLAVLYFIAVLYSLMCSLLVLAPNGFDMGASPEKVLLYALACAALTVSLLGIPLRFLLRRRAT